MLTELSKTFRFLLDARNADGGWPYYGGRHSAPEPTCYAAMALGSRFGPKHDACRAGAEWLRSHTGRGTGEPVWTRSVALLAFSFLDVFPDYRSQLTRDLLVMRGKPSPRTAINELDPTIPGWSWADGTFSWVEPTSYALLALKRSGMRAHERIRDGERLLLDRVCDDGGWNCGNRKMRGQALTSMTGPTALAALALQGAPAAAGRVQRACDVLEREAGRWMSSLAGALTILCFDVSQRATAELAARLAQRQSADGSWRGQVHLTGLSVLALSASFGGNNAFRV